MMLSNETVLPDSHRLSTNDVLSQNWLNIRVARPQIAGISAQQQV